MSKHDYNETEAMKQLIEGNEKGLHELYQKYSHGAYRAALRILKSPELAEDVVQELFFSVWANRKKFEAVDSFQTYLNKMCFNLAIRYLKDIVKRKEKENEYITSTPGWAVNDAQYNMLVSEVRSAIQNLPEKQRLVFNLYLFERYTRKDVAEKLGVSFNTVNTHLSEAFKAVRLQLKLSAINLVLAVFSFLHSNAGS